MNLRSQKRLAARILKCGVTRVRLRSEKEVEEAITREDIRNLIRKGLIWKVQKRGQVGAFSRMRASQRKKGRRRGFGSRRGKAGARNPTKKQWIRTIRSVRRTLKGLKEYGMVEGRAYRKLYLMAKGGSFKSRRHLLLYMKDRELLKAKEPVSKPEPAGKAGKGKPAKREGNK